MVPVCVVSHQAGEGQLPNEQLRALLVLADLPQGHRPGAVPGLLCACGPRQDLPMQDIWLQGKLKLTAKMGHTELNKIKRFEWHRHVCSGIVMCALRTDLQAYPMRPMIHAVGTWSIGG